MKKNLIMLTLLILGLSFQCTTSEWIPLFNRHDLTGWTIKKAPADSAFQFWTVKDATIEANSIGNTQHDYVWLLSEKEYRDFEIQFKLQAFRDSPGNSGLQIRSRYDDEAAWLDGPQIDINPPGPWRSGMMWSETREDKGWLYPALPTGEWVDTTMAKNSFPFYYADDEPAWNDMRVRVKGLSVDVWINGVQVTDYDGTGVLNNDFHRKYNVGEKGFLAFQIHKKDELKIRFKDIYLREL